MADIDVNVRARAQHQRNTLETIPTSPAHTPHGDLPNTPLMASAIAFALGTIFALGLPARLLTGAQQTLWWNTYPLAFFASVWAAFHWLEFAITAGWNREKCTVDSFLLNNGWLYHFANSLALTEYLLTLYFKPSWKTNSYIFVIGVCLTLAGQFIRSSAMISANTNFSHSVQLKKAESHRLVTEGVYAYFRHPSYAGFFYWSLGTQLALQNPVSFVVFFLILWRFFSSRIKVEERALVLFFGEEYKSYRRRVSTRIPFVP